jgi:hypothetical protein
MTRADGRLFAVVLTSAFWCASAVGQTGADSCTTAPVVSEGVFPLSTAGFTIAGPQASCGVAPDPFDSWFVYTPSGSGYATFSTCPASTLIPGGGVTINGSGNLDSIVAIWSADTCPPTQMLGCADGAPGCDVVQAEFSMNVTAGATYYVQVANWSFATPFSGTVAIALAGGGGTPGPGDVCATAIPQAGPGFATLATTTATTALPAAACGSSPDYYDQWIAYTAATTGVSYVSTCASSVNAPGGSNAGVPTYLAMYAACPTAPGSEAMCDFGVASPCGPSNGAELAFQAQAGSTYLIRVGDLSGSGGVAGVTVAFAESVPTPILNPANGHRYVLTLAPSSFLNARAEATAMGGYLATVNDAAEQAWLAATFPGQDLWIGLTDEAVEGTFVWDSGEPVSYLNWCPGQPDNACASVGEDYVHLYTGCAAKWNDLPNAGCGGTQLKRGVIELATTLQAPAAAGVGSVVDYALFSPYPNSIYWFDVSLTGSSPGVPIGGGFVIPLNLPWLNVALNASYPGFVGFVGVTGPTGGAAAQVVLPPIPSLAGAVITASFVIVDLGSPYLVAAVAPAVATTVLGPTPAISSVSPPIGPASGGTPATIAGSDFQSGATVKFGTSTATVFAQSPTSISCVAPPGSPGAVDVSVTNPDGQIATLSGGFVYVPNLTLASVAPTVAAPGTTVTLTGAGFSPGMTVSAGGVPVTLTTATATVATFPFPASAACGSTVVVASPFGQFAVLPFNPPPVVTGTLFASGSHNGGLPFFITGSNFVPGTTVTIGGTPATIALLLPTTLSITTPPGAVGPAAVVVTSPSGCTATTTYTYL